MANKFTKSVLERQAKESKNMPTPKESVEYKKESMDIVSEPQEEQKQVAPSMNLDAFIIKDSTRSAKNKTFYLDTAVIDAIHRAAKSKNVNDSKLVNDILKKILQVD